MDKLSGLILDVYDDQGALLKEYFPKLADVPDLVKTAHLLSMEERLELPDDSFALVLQNNDVVLRKFACVDPGNTLLSILYFEKIGHKLPKEAMEVVAENLQTACRWYWESPDDFVKSAGIGGAAMNLLGGLAKGAIKNPMGTVGKVMTGMSVYGAGKQIANNLRGVGMQEASRGGFGQVIG